MNQGTCGRRGLTRGRAAAGRVRGGDRAARLGHGRRSGSRPGTGRRAPGRRRGAGRSARRLAGPRGAGRRHRGHPRRSRSRRGRLARLCPCGRAHPGGRPAAGRRRARARPRCRTARGRPPCRRRRACRGRRHRPSDSPADGLVDGIDLDRPVATPPAGWTPDRPARSTAGPPAARPTSAWSPPPRMPRTGSSTRSWYAAATPSGTSPPGTSARCLGRRHRRRVAPLVRRQPRRHRRRPRPAPARRSGWSPPA